MTRKLIAGNWKMNGQLEDGRSRVAALAEGLTADAGACDWAVCPPFTLLHPLAAALSDAGIALGGQDCHAEAAGAHTGDIGAAMLADLGCRYVIVGHSERRQDHGESDAAVRAKADAALAAGLTPILCIGETQAQRDAGQTAEVLRRQIAGSLAADAPGRGTVVVAYEPVWAIGTGRTATVQQVAETHDQVRADLRAHLGAAGGEIRVLYGGSVKPGNAAELLALPDVDGALVGGASLDPESFLAIGRAASDSRGA